MAKQTQGKSVVKAAKKAVTKTAAPKRKPAGGGKAAAKSVAPEQRRHMISEAAYFIAEQRGFNGGDTVRDWLLAEAEIDRRLSPRK